MMISVNSVTLYCVFINISLIMFQLYVGKEAIKERLFSPCLSGQQFLRYSFDPH